MSGYNYSYDNIVLTEMLRNHAGYELVKRFLQKAFGPKVGVVINHHIVYELQVDGKRRTEEIPSMDTLLFSPYYMGLVFGDQASPVMHALVLCEPKDREAHLLRELDTLEAAEVLARQRAVSRQPLALRSSQQVITVVGERVPDEQENQANKV